MLPESLEKRTRVLEAYDRWGVQQGFPTIGAFLMLTARQVSALMAVRLQRMTLDADPPSCGGFLLAGLVNRHPCLRRDLAES